MKKIFVICTYVILIAGSKTLIARARASCYADCLMLHPTEQRLWKKKANGNSLSEAYKKLETLCTADLGEIANPRVRGFENYGLPAGYDIEVGFAYCKLHY